MLTNLAYTPVMELRRISHAVYDTGYHLVCAPKYRWEGKFWEDGYFARTVGDEVTTEIICKYIQYHQEREGIPEQLELF